MAEPATFLITGATGLVGFRILLAVLAAGHTVRYTARSEEKVRAVSSNPAIKKLAPGARLTPVITPDLNIEGVLDDALQGVTHVIHAGSPLPMPTFDPVTQVFEPTVKMSSNVLSSALKSPSVKRVIITSSTVSNSPLDQQPTTALFASSRQQPPNPIPSTINIFEAYVLGKMVEVHNSDELIRTKTPHFTVSHIMPGYVFGRNELALDPKMMQFQNSSNYYLMVALLGGEERLPIRSGFAHIDDVAEAHLRAAFLDPKTAGFPQDFGISTAVDYTTTFDYAEKAFPKAVAAGVFKRGRISNVCVDYDSSDAERLLGRPLRSFESTVVEVAGQYLETLGVARE
ncbi:putative cinnamoyl-CoA reductase [Xylaria intraflava]|nr:putative cinnamoyl-CoA reductase [Xylaria intraflava]